MQVPLLHLSGLQGAPGDTEMSSVCIGAYIARRDDVRRIMTKPVSAERSLANFLSPEICTRNNVFAVNLLYYGRTVGIPQTFRGGPEVAVAQIRSWQERGHAESATTVTLSCN